MTKGVVAMLVYTTIECNYSFIVIVHQHGGYNVTCKPRIRSSGIVLLLEHLNTNSFAVLLRLIALSLGNL